MSAKDGVNSSSSEEPSQEDVIVPFASFAGKVQSAPLPVPLQNPILLPLANLDPEVLERLAAEIVSRHDNHGVQFYGRRGQAQYGLDIVERKRTGARWLYQVKRYQQLSPGQIAAAVTEYAGDPRDVDYEGKPRRFDPRVFVLVTSASLDSDAANVDEIARLQNAYQSDIGIEVWGRESLSRKLRDAPHLVYSVFGPEWARAFCGFVPTPRSLNEPRPLALVEAPTEVLGLASMLADADEREQVDPSQAATLFSHIALDLKEHGFPGHADLMSRRQAAALKKAGNFVHAFDVSWRLALERVSVAACQTRYSHMIWTISLKSSRLCIKQSGPHSMQLSIGTRWGPSLM